MGYKSMIIKSFAKNISSKIERWKFTALNDQALILKNNLEKAKNTAIGKERGFKNIKNYDDYQAKNPALDYEGIKPYIERIKSGERDILWPGQPKYFAKTSGTTSGVKYIPISNDSIPNHIHTAKNALLHYVSKYNASQIFDGKFIFLSGSPELERTGAIPTGRLSGIVNLEVPKWLKKGQVPTLKTNSIADWESKLDAIVEETYRIDLRLISGIPPWVQMYLERLLAKTGKSTIKEIFPNLSMFIYGGVNYTPYKQTLERLFGFNIPSIETFPASEGFFAFKDDKDSPDLLLNTNSGIFFEFIEAETFGQNNQKRVSLREVEIGKPYALVVSNNAGLWSYSIGDVITFTSKEPFKLIFSGRISHYISAFGEHVIAKEVEEAIANTIRQHPASVIEFTVSPQVSPQDGGLPFHEWFIEFDVEPQDIKSFEKTLNDEMIKQNIYYQDLIEGNILQKLKIVKCKKGIFINYMRNIGKLGGQNKVPRLVNDRKIADELLKLNI